MYQVTYLLTNTILPDLFHSEGEAKRRATEHYATLLQKSPIGRRTLISLKHVVKWKNAESKYLITELVGVFMDTDQGNIFPEVTTEDNALVFVTASGKHLGDYDDSEGLYLDNLGNTYTPEQVVEFMVLPDCIKDRLGS